MSTIIIFYHINLGYIKLAYYGR